MFTFRRKSKKAAANGPPYIRSTPSLPDLSAQGIQWPEDLIDVSELPPVKLPPVQTQPATVRHSNGKAAGPISDMYMSHPPSAFGNRKSTYIGRRKPTQRKSRSPTTFNIMVAGAQGTGKTSLLRLLLETAEVSPNTTDEQRAKLHAFLQDAPKRTEDIQAVPVEICESKYDRVALSVIDTPGLDFQPGHELRLERQVSSIVRYLDAQFADTLSEESKIVRESKGDQHVHLCIYTIDPSSIMTAAERRSLASHALRPRSEQRVSYQPSDVSAAPSSRQHSAESADVDGDDAPGDLTMSPADIGVMQRLTKKTNLLPVVARADSLTDDMLASYKNVIRRDLAAAGLDFGVFGSPKSDSQPPNANNSSDQRASGNGNNAQSDDDDEKDHADGSGPEERLSRPIVKIRVTRNPFKFRSNSRTRPRLDLTENADEPSSADMLDSESLASVRFSAQTISKANLLDLLPFALIAPEHSHAHSHSPRVSSQISRSASSEDRHSDSIHAQVHEGDAAASAVSPTDDGHRHGAESIVASPASAHAKNVPFLDGPPAVLRDVFTRSYRWGTIDVLAPEHCDFAALRTAVLSTHMKMLKIRTKEVLYERYRTEKLLARRATRNISEDEQRRMFAEIGL